MTASTSEICVQRNILIVDDTAENLKLLSDFLSGAGYKVRPANSGKVALDAVQTILPDLVLLDIMMPGIDGYEVCRRLKADVATKDIPVIFISAAEGVDDRLEAFRLGGVDYISKPFQPDEVIARVRLHLQLRDSQLLLQEEVRAHEQAKEELARHREGLEEMVHHRTRELAAMNRKLQEEIDFRRSTESALRESEERYHGLVDAGFQGVLIHREGEIVFANEALCKLLGRSVEDFAGEDILNLLPPEDHEMIRESIRTDHHKIMGHGVLNAQGISLPVESIGFESVYQGEPARVVTIRDISEKISLRNEAERANRLASLGELAAGIAHEVNNPNAVILLNIPVVRKILNDVWPCIEECRQLNSDLTLAGLPVDEVRRELPKMLERIEESGDRIRQIVDDLKAFVREKVDRPHQRIDLNLVVTAACRLMENSIRKATGCFEMKLSEEPVIIHGDFQRVEQVVINLVQNACHALEHDHQRIVVQTVKNHAGAGILMVSDEGCGIKKEDIPRVTNPFFTTRRSDGGTGLGLSVSARILQEHQASLNLQSSPGEGTVFTVSFPAVEKEQAE